MSSNNDGLQFSNFDLTDDQENDNQEDITRKNYNPISEVTKPENFEFEFEPDEDIDNEITNLQLNIKQEIPEIADNQQHEVSNNTQENKTAIIAITEDADDELLLTTNHADVVLDAEKLNNNNTGIISKFQEVSLINDDISEDYSNDNNTKFSALEISDYDIDFPEQKNNIDENLENKYSEKPFEINDINENDAEDILAQVLAEDYNAPIIGFEKFIERKRIRDEASKALDGDNYQEIDLDLDIYEKSEEEMASDDIMGSYGSDLNNQLLEDDFDISDITDMTLEQDHNHNTAALEKLFDEDLKLDNDIEKVSEDLDEELDLNDLDIEYAERDTEKSDDIEISEVEFNYEDDDEDNYDIGIDDEGFTLNLSSGEEDSEEDEIPDDEFDFGEEEDYDTGIDDEGFTLDLNSGEEDSEEDEISDDEFDFNFDTSEENTNDIFATDDFGIADSDNAVTAVSEFDENEFDFGEEIENSDDSDYNRTVTDNEFSGIDFVNTEAENSFSDSDEFDFNTDDQFDNSDFNDNEEFDFSDNTFNIDSIDNEDADDLFSEDDYAENLSDYERTELTSQTQQHLLRIRTIIKKLPDTSKELTNYTKAFLKKLKEIKNEIKEEGFRPVLKKYIHNSKKQVESSVKKVNQALKKKVISNKTATAEGNKKSAITEWNNEGTEDTWGLGPGTQQNHIENQRIDSQPAGNDEADWEDEDISFSTADMLMEDVELGLGEFDSNKADEEEEEDTTDYSGFIGKLRKIKKLVRKWSKLLYKYLDSKVNFEKNWWKVVDFVAVIVLTTALAMVVAYYIWHK